LFADIVKMLRGGYECPAIKPVPADMKDEEVTRSFLGVLQPHADEPGLHEIHEASQDLRHAQPARRRAHAVLDGSVKAMQSMFFTSRRVIRDRRGIRTSYISQRATARCAARGSRWMMRRSKTAACMSSRSRIARVISTRSARTRDWRNGFAPESYGF